MNLEDEDNKQQAALRIYANQTTRSLGSLLPCPNFTSTVFRFLKVKALGALGEGPNKIFTNLHFLYCTP